MQIAEIQISYSPNKSKKIWIKDSKTTYAALTSHWDDDTIEYIEEAYLLCLNQAHAVLGIKKIGQGGINGCVMDPRVIFQTALKANASAIIIAHNHPSGNLTPSQADLQLTKNLRTSGKLLEISVLDHLIIGDDAFYSFADEGLM